MEKLEDLTGSLRETSMPGIGELTALYEGDFVNGSGDFSIVVVLVLLPLSAEDEPLDGESLRGLFGFMRFAGANVGKLVWLTGASDGAAASGGICCCDLYECCGLATTGTFNIVDE